MNIKYFKIKNYTKTFLNLFRNIEKKILRLHSEWTQLSWDILIHFCVYIYVFKTLICVSDWDSFICDCPSFLLNFEIWQEIIIKKNNQKLKKITRNSCTSWQTDFTFYAPNYFLPNIKTVFPKEIKTRFKIQKPMLIYMLYKHFQE